MMNLKIFKIAIGLVIVISLAACNYSSNIMMKDKNYPFDAAPSDTSAEYIISPSDIIEFKLYTNDGSLLIDFTAIKEQQTTSVTRSTSFQYLVEFDGQTKLPIIGRINLKGKSIKEVEALLEEKYAKYYIKPFVQVQVTNKRITVFPGGNGKAKVIPLSNNNMTILEALGAVGGLTNLAKANRIKLIRGDLKDPEVYLFDFTTIDGIKQSGFVLQANDMIYVEPRSNSFQELVRDVAPVVSLIASTLTLLIIISNQTN